MMTSAVGKICGVKTAPVAKFCKECAVIHTASTGAIWTAQDSFYVSRSVANAEDNKHQ